MASRQDIDMGVTFDWFGKKSHPDYTGVTEAQYANRMLLQELMVKHGFCPPDSEWWHFTLGNEPYWNTCFTFPVSSASINIAMMVCGSTPVLPTIF